MKIQLEHKLESCPEQLLCAVCGQIFLVQQIRTLLYSDRGLLQGDICPHCQKLNEENFKKKIYQRASFLWQNADVTDNQDLLKVTARRDRGLLDDQKSRALELLTIAQEKVKFPNFLERWFKKMEILAQESNELEQARFGLSKCYCQERQRLEYLFKESET
jgi:hypothetical protein